VCYNVFPRFLALVSALEILFKQTQDNNPQGQRRKKSINSKHTARIANLNLQSGPTMPTSMFFPDTWPSNLQRPWIRTLKA
jgi:hypothetical protein